MKYSYENPVEIVDETFGVVAMHVLASLKSGDQSLYHKYRDHQPPQVTTATPHDGNVSWVLPSTPNPPRGYVMAFFVEISAPESYFLPSH